jgi:hypothetical protein
MFGFSASMRAGKALSSRCSLYVSLRRTAVDIWSATVAGTAAGSIRRLLSAVRIADVTGGTWTVDAASSIAADIFGHVAGAVERNRAGHHVVRRCDRG